MRYCSPALLYLIISTFSILLASSMNVLPIFILTKVAFTLLWAWFLNFLCVKGYKRVSWILVLVPYMIIIMNIFILLTTDVCVEEGFVEGRTGISRSGPLKNLFISPKKKKKKNDAEKEEDARKKEEKKRRKEEKKRRKEEEARIKEENARRKKEAEDKAKKDAEKAKKDSEDKAKREADETTDETPDNAISTTSSPYQRQPTYVEDPEDW